MDDAAEVDYNKDGFALINDKKQLRVVKLDTRKSYVVYKRLRGVTGSKLVKLLKDIYNCEGGHTVEYTEKNDDIGGVSEDNRGNDRYLYYDASRYLDQVDGKHIQSEEAFLDTDSGLRKNGKKLTHKDLIEQ